MTEKERLTWGLLLCGEPELGAASLRKIKQGLVNVQASVSDFWQEPRAFSAWLGRDAVKKLAAIERVKQTWTEEKLAQYLARNQVRISVLGDPDYPLLLRYVPDFAPVLFYQGDLGVTAKPTLAVVGSRKVSAGGKMSVQYLLDESIKNLTIVSGMMIGVDRLAHERALEIGAPTVAVLGYGTDLTWPRELTALRARILASGGLILSEYAPWSEPQAWRFPQRNRLVAGLSLATLVIEAASKSGSLITANLALDYGREVLAVPGSIFNENTKGCHELLRHGAALTDAPEVILETILSSRVNLLPEAFYQKLEGEGPLFEANLTGKARNKEFSDPVQNQIYQLLASEKLMVEELSEKLQLNLAEVMGAASLLELAGEIKQTSDGRWEIIVI